MLNEKPGQIVILNGVPRSGKSSIAKSIQESFDGVWVNLGVDVWMEATPERLRPGVGLRPGGERPDLEPEILNIYRESFAGVAVCSRSGTNVVVDVGLHEGYAGKLHVLRTCAEQLEGLPVLFVGVRCPTPVVLQRRRASGWRDESRVELWEKEVHGRWTYDLEVDTSQLSPEACAAQIGAFLQSRDKADAFWESAARAI